MLLAEAGRGTIVQYRIVRSDYELGIVQEEPGGIQDPVERPVGEKVVRTFEYVGDPKELTAEKLGLEDCRYPTGEEDGDVLVGSIISSYRLETAEGRYIATIHPYPSSERRSYAEDDMGDDEDRWDESADAGMSEEDLERWRQFGESYTPLDEMLWGHSYPISLSEPH
jgi:hypothetical protein